MSDEPFRLKLRQGSPLAMEQRISELEAQCAALRAALLAVERATEPMQAGDCLGCTWNPGHDLTCPVGNALASDAGKELLERLGKAMNAEDQLADYVHDHEALLDEVATLKERLEKAEELFQQATRDRVEMMGKIIAMSDGWKGAYAQALEEAAKVADTRVGHCYMWDERSTREEIAAAIRALKEGK